MTSPEPCTKKLGSIEIPASNLRYFDLAFTYQEYFHALLNSPNSSNVIRPVFFIVMPSLAVKNIPQLRKKQASFVPFFQSAWA
jgi:hypothetical protein